MHVQGIAWVGTRTEHWSDTVEMFERHLGLRRSHELPGITVFGLDNGDTVEVFTIDEPDHLHFTMGPVVGFAVDDIEAASRTGGRRHRRPGPDPARGRPDVAALPRGRRQRLGADGQGHFVAWWSLMPAHAPPR